MSKKWLFLYLMVVFIWSGPLYCQEDEELLQESVRVVNVEVPVRVYFQGQPVDNLTKSDFTLYEGRKRQEIHGFILKRKRIKVQALELNARQVKEPVSRYFTLVFRITHYNDYLKRGLDYIFDNVLREPDQLLVFINDQSAFFKSLEDKESVKKRLDRMLRDMSLKARNKMMLYLKNIESMVTKFKYEKNAMTGKIVSEYWIVHDYLRDYLKMWKEYKKKYLVPDINKYYNFARFLKNIKKEKWVINFYQFEMFPNVIINSRDMRYIRSKLAEWQLSDGESQAAVVIISRLLAEIEKEMSVAKDFPADEVAKIFHNVDATFHSIFIRTTLEALHEDIEYKHIASELENSLRAITDRTGGELVVSNKLDEALDRISEIEDLYYVLTYAPKNPDKVGKIKVKLKNRKYDLVYSPNLRSGYLSQFFDDKEIKGKEPSIDGLNFRSGQLKFVVSDFFWDKKKGGALGIRIRIHNPMGQSVFDQKKVFKATQKKINISLNFKNLESGEHDFVVDVNDLFTGMATTRLLKTKI